MNEPTQPTTSPFAQAAGEVFSAPEPEETPIVPTIEPGQTASAAKANEPVSGTTTTQPTQPTTPTTQPTPQPATPLTAEAIAAAVKAAVQPATQQPQMTEAELDAMFKVWKPSPELVAKIQAGGDDALSALTEVRDGLLQQFNTFTEHRLGLLQQQLLQQLKPALDFASKQAAETEKAEFFKEYPDLQGHEPLLNLVYEQMLAQKVNFPSVAEARKALADRTKALIPGSAAGQPAGGGQQTTTQPAVQQPAALSSGSQAGGGAGGGGSAPANVFHELWGK